MPRSVASSSFIVGMTLVTISTWQPCSCSGPLGRGQHGLVVGYPAEAPVELVVEALHVDAVGVEVRRDGVEGLGA